MQSSQYRRLEIRVWEAHGLAKADKFGPSDPYVVIRANGEKQVMDGRKFWGHQSSLSLT